MTNKLHSQLVGIQCLLEILTVEIESASGAAFEKWTQNENENSHQTGLKVSTLISPIVKPITHDESKWYGSYDTLLTNMFPWIGHGNGYVVPQFEVYSGTHNYIDFTIQGQFFAFVVEHFHHPILLIDVKPCTAIKYIGSRARADLLMRQRMDHLYENCHLPCSMASVPE
jgi:hypothetical protein